MGGNHLEVLWRCQAVGLALTCALSTLAADSATVPDWAAEAVWYQVFPERFANGDAANDPTRDSLEFPKRVPTDWSVRPWTSSWYERSEWERRLGDDFYRNGVYDRRYGGDLQGVIERLDYLDRLGIDAIYFNPLFHAASLHKYDGSSFHHIDPHFGPDPAGDLAKIAGETEDPTTWCWTEADKLFLKLIEECHRREIRVVIDGVFNHTGRDFFAFRDLKEHQEASRYRDWYVVHSFDKSETRHDEFRYEGWWGSMTLPIFADNAAGEDLGEGPKQYVHEITRRWMDPDGDGDPADGVDGWRLDVATEVPVGFWNEWNALVRELNPEAYTVAEDWNDSAAFLAAGGFSATMNYHGFSRPVKGFVIDGALRASEFARMLVDRMLAYPENQRHALLNLIDSHDTERVASMVVNATRRLPYEDPETFDYDGRRASARGDHGYRLRRPNQREQRLQRIVAVLQATCVGAPMIYYGTEAGMWGGDDPDDRKPMIWPDLEYDPETAGPDGRVNRYDVVTFDHGLHSFYRGVVTLRHYFPSLQRGGFEVLRTDDAAGGLVFRRRDSEGAVYVAVNRGDGPWATELKLESGVKLREVFTASGEPHRVRVDPVDGGARITLPQREAVVFLPASK